MDFITKFSEELENPDTRYFIFDTKGSGIKHDDADFIKYSWRTNMYGQVRPGDIFIYRRPGKASETKQFYFFGAGRIDAISPANGSDVDDETRVNGSITKPFPFETFLHQADLDHFNWHFKSRKHGSWEHFFNQYGMNRIDKRDFVQLITLSQKHLDYDYDVEMATSTSQAMQRGNYHADDEVSFAKRRTKQSVFSNNVKNLYGNQCALCKLKTKALLTGSHIVPWSARKDIRLDPANGISLCVMHDKLFDAGYITLSSKLTVIVSESVKEDPVLAKIAGEIEGKTLNKPKNFAPKAEYLHYHRAVVFEKFLNKTM
ncbi:HNH endonuclease [Salinimonas chungwhensis]|uniref:HNH endonuclease n=1 Tax=Salinimonas chungwhensis TaxID=265425 RepID=UPI0003A7858B|nr:HNH endonuclease [Salinimonas chungwhensis]